MSGELGIQAVLSCRVDGATLGLGLSDVSEILLPRPLTRVPHAPASLLGLVNLRGTVVPVISLAALCGRAVPALTASSRLIVIWPRAPVALLVDAVYSLAEEATAQRLDVSALLTRDFSPLLRRASAQMVSAVEAAPGAAPALFERALITFELLGQDYALPLDMVAEIARLPDSVAALPQTDAAMMGVIAFRGGLLPLVSLRALLGLPPRGPAELQSRIVVIHFGAELIGLVADAVGSILRVPETSIDAVPRVLTRGSSEARIAAICRLDDGHRLISLLSAAHLFDAATAARVRLAVQGKAATMPGSDNAHGLDAGHGGKTEQFVLFQLGGEAYGLPISAVEEVVRHPGELTRMPRAPDFVEGVMNLRGKAVPVINQRQRFAIDGAGEMRGARVVIVRLDGQFVGFAVDSVAEIIAVAGADIITAPALGDDGRQVFDRVVTSGKEGRMVLILDPQAMLERAERDILAALAADVSAS